MHIPRPMKLAVLGACLLVAQMTASCISNAEKQPEPTSSRSTTAEDANGCSSRCLSGDCMDGTGIYEFADCSVYEGQFSDGSRNGKGKYIFPSGASLHGNFRNGRPVGAFSYRFPEGAVFNGELSADDVVASDNRFHIEGATGVLIEEGRRRSCVVNNLRLLCDPADSEASDVSEAADASGESSRTSSHSTPEDRTSEESAVVSSAQRNEPQPPEGLDSDEIRFLVLYAPESASLLRKGEEFSVSAGHPLAPGDVIITRQHSADIQGEGGFAIRLKPFSELQIPENAREERVLLLKKGSLIVDYDGEGPLPFRVRSGGMNIDVKGTTFVVEAAGEENRVTVRVIEGEVQISPDEATLEKARKSDLQAHPQLREALKNLPEAFSVKAGEEANAPVLEEEASPEEMARSLEELNEGAVNEADADKLARDAGEAALMPVLPDEDFEEAAEVALDKDPESRRESGRKLEEKYRKTVEERGDELEQQLEVSSRIESPEDFRRAYPILEVVYLRSGEKRAGSVIAQAGGLLFLFAPDGLYRVPVPDVSHIDYYNRDEMDLEILRNQALEKKKSETGANPQTE